MLFETEVVAYICHSPLHHQKPDFEGQSVIKTSSYLLPFVLEAHRESLPRFCETSARRLSAESAEVYSIADLPTSAAHTFPSHRDMKRRIREYEGVFFFVFYAVSNCLIQYDRRVENNARIILSYNKM